MSSWKVTREELEALLECAEVEEHIYFDKVLVVEYKIKPHGFTVGGRAAVVDPVNFRLEIGREIARENALNKLWELEGYRKQLEMLETEKQ
jgi:hypothetical protein